MRTKRSILMTTPLLALLIFTRVADGDGVVVVPCAKAKLVAEYARETMDKDRAAGRSLYKRLGMQLDDSLK